MVRSILSVLVGYLVMALVVVLSFAPVIAVPELAFRSGTAEAAPAFVVYSLLMSGLAAAVGGFVAAVIAGKGRKMPVRVLGILILAFGLASAVASLFAEKPIVVSPEEVAQMTPMERAQKGREPLWYALVLPFIGCGGVLCGGAIRDRQLVV